MLVVYFCSCVDILNRTTSRRRKSIQGRRRQLELIFCSSTDLRDILWLCAVLFRDFLLPLLRKNSHLNSSPGWVDGLVWSTSRQHAKPEVDERGFWGIQQEWDIIQGENIETLKLYDGPSRYLHNEAITRRITPEHYTIHAIQPPASSSTQERMLRRCPSGLEEMLNADGGGYWVDKGRSGRLGEGHFYHWWWSCLLPCVVTHKSITIEIISLVFYLTKNGPLFSNALLSSVLKHYETTIHSINR